MEPPNGAPNVRTARATVAAFEAARASGRAGARLGNRLIEMPIFLNAKRLIARADALAALR
jgi:citrate lyase subunit beta/citryl-CoA lyase